LGVRLDYRSNILQQLRETRFGRLPTPLLKGISNRVVVTLIKAFADRASVSAQLSFGFGLPPKP